MDLVSIAPDGGWLLAPGGAPFFAVIVNYVGHSDRAWAQFQAGKFDPALIEADCRLAQRSGANTLRTFVAPPLQNEFPQGNWVKLDALVAAAERAGIYLLLTFADYSLSYVKTLAAHAGLIAARYKGRPGILAYDLKNEPRFYHLALMRYPGANPLLATDLSPIYPSKRTREQALAWARGEGNAPSSLSDVDALRYAHVSEVLDAFLRAASDWVSARSYNVSTVDFMRSPAAAAWQPFLEKLNAAAAAWLAPQIAAVRAADPARLITVGYSDPLLAGLAANKALDILAINRYPRDASPRQLDFQLTIARGLQTAFPGKPVLLTEFGYATSEVEPVQAAICEGAAWLRAYEMGLAGAGKWMLWDLPPGPNPRERSFGLFTAAGEPKPSALALPALSARLASSRAPRGRLEVGASASGSIAYKYTADDAVFTVGYGRAETGPVRWEGEGWGQVFADWAEAGVVRVSVTAAGQVTLDLSQMLGISELADYTIEAGGAPCEHTRAGSVVVFPAAPGVPVALRWSLSAIDAKIAIVWPHGDAPVAEARLANLTAYLTFPGSRVSVPCNCTPQVTLWRALNNEPAEPVIAGARRLADLNGRRVPVWDFNDVDISAARDPVNKLYFGVRLAGGPYRANVWVHGLDARTYLPRPVTPSGTQVVKATDVPAELDARIQIVWPHGGAPVDQARLANISADLFAHGTRVALAPSGSGTTAWAPAVWLVRALNNEVGVRVARGQARREGAAVHWDFNDVDVSPARHPQSKLHFWIEVDGIRTCSNFWTHGLDARTYLPNPDLLLGDCMEEGRPS
jgi:hypothetical protein